MGYWSHVPDACHYQAGPLKGTNGSLPAGSGTLNQHVDLPKALVHTSTGNLLGGSLGSEGGAFAGAFESHRAGAGGSNYAPLRVGYAYQRVVESGINIGPALRHGASFSFSRSRSGHTDPPVTSCRRFAVHGRPLCGEVLFGCEHWSGCAGRGREDPAGGVTPGKILSR